MQEISVVTDQDRAHRATELRAMKAAEERDYLAQEEADRRANSDFVQVTPKGWARMQKLMKENLPAARIYAFLAEHIDAVAGAVVVSQEVIAQEIGVHVRTVKRHTAYLEDQGCLVRIKVGIGVYAYCLDPHEIWRSWHKGKETAAFVTRTLVSKRDQPGTVDRRLRMMVSELQPDAVQA
jgi:DNA-binding MarR family transcriptional regulator